MRKNIVLLLGFSIFGWLNCFGQRSNDTGYSFMSPGYAFSMVSYKDDSASYYFNSHNVSIGLLRFETSMGKVMIVGGASIQYITSRLTYTDLRNQNRDVRDAKISFFGMSPELVIRYFPLFQLSDEVSRPSGAFIGLGAQFLLPIAKNNEVQLNSLRPTFQLGISKKKTFSIVMAPSFLKPSNKEINLTSPWYFGFDVDLFRF